MRVSVWFALLCVSGSWAAFSQSVRPNTSDFPFPGALSGETRKLEFHVSLPAGGGSLQTQTNAALKELLRKSRHAAILKLRVFAVGSDDLMAVRQIVGQTFKSRKKPLPVLSLVGVASFPEPGQRVEIESIAMGRKQVNSNGVEFLAGFASPSGDQTISGLARVARESGVTMLDVLRVSCFYESSTQVAAAKAAVAVTFPAAESSFILSYAADGKPVIECEAVARLSATIPEGVRYFNLPGSKPSPYFSRAALVSLPKLIFTDTEMAIGDSAAEIRDSYDRTKEAVEPLGGRLPDVVMGHNYWLTPAARDRHREVRPDYFGQTVPAATGVFFAGLASPKATAAIELVVAVTDTVTLTIDNPIMDGTRVYKPHLVSVVDSLTKNGVVLQSNRATLDTFVTQRNGSPVLRLLSESGPEGTEPDLHTEALLDLKTLAMLHYEERGGSGTTLTADVYGAHVTGRTQSGHGADSLPFDFTLDTPSYFSPFVGLAINATTLRNGEVVKIPTFDFSAHKTEWHRYRVSGRETMRIQGRKVSAWIIEEDSEGPHKAHKIWLIKDPPYFPLELIYLPDGSIRRLERALVREHP